MWVIMINQAFVHIALLILSLFCVAVISLLIRMYAEIGIVHRRVDVLLRKVGSWHQKVDRLHEDMHNLRLGSEEDEGIVVLNSENLVDMNSRQLLNKLNVPGYSTKKTKRQ
jgi:hypothetical protein